MTAKAKKDFFIKIRVSEDEKKIIENKASDYEISISDLIRICILDYKVRYNRHQKEFVRHFARASSNLNQIARSVNIYKYNIDKIQLIVCLAKIEEELKELRKCI